jgi:transcriptional regulator with XRE-family HTH domain
MKKEYIGERLVSLMKALKIKSGDFANKAEISQSLISNIIAGKNGPSKATINLICRTYGVNKEWLLTGKGEMLLPVDGQLGNLTSNERELLEIYDKLMPKTQKEVLDYANEKLELQELREKNGEGKAFPKPEPDFPLVPRYHVPPPAPDSAPASTGIEEDEAAG